MELNESLHRHGGVVSLSELRHDHVSNQERLHALREGELHRLRNGWFADSSAPTDVARAVRVGGRLSCVSLLSTLGLWMMPDDRLHVAVPQNAARLRSPNDKTLRLESKSPSVVVHWGQFDWAPPRTESSDSIIAALGHAILCQPRESALVAIDSALNKRLITTRQLRGILEHLPASKSGLAASADGRAQSGLETLTRLHIGSKRIRVRIQVSIAGVGDVDTLIGDRLIVELDSRTHHLGDNYEKDRTRDLHATALGYIVLRVSYYRVMYDWPSIEEVIIELVRRDDHLWSGMHRRLGLAAAN